MYSRTKVGIPSANVNYEYRRIPKSFLFLCSTQEFMFVIFSEGPILYQT